jgi:hypothetical protein
MGLSVSDSLLVLPQEVYDCQAAAALKLSDLQLMLRSHEYAMGKWDWSCSENN